MSDLSAARLPRVRRAGAHQDEGAERRPRVPGRGPGGGARAEGAAAFRERAAVTQNGDSSLLARLGVIGMEAIEAVVLCALIGGEPLLLVEPHRTRES